MSDERPTSEVKITGDGNVVGDESQAQILKVEKGITVGSIAQTQIGRFILQLFRSDDISAILTGLLVVTLLGELLLLPSSLFSLVVSLYSPLESISEMPQSAFQVVRSYLSLACLLYAAASVLCMIPTCTVFSMALTVFGLVVSRILKNPLNRALSLWVGLASLLLLLEMCGWASLQIAGSTLQMGR